MADDKEWSEDVEHDPIKMQREALDIQKKFMAKVEAQERKEEERKKKAEAEAVAYGPPRLGVVKAYTPPTFEEISVATKKAWDEVEKIMPKAPDRAKAVAFQTLMHAAMPSSGGYIA